jgi:hypothetical protein
VDVVVATTGGSDKMAFIYEEPTISMKLSGNAITLTGLIGDLWGDYLTANVITNNPSGYKLSVSASEPRVICKRMENGVEMEYAIEPMAGTGVLDGMANVNRWGYAKDGGLLAEPSVWTGVTSGLGEIESYGLATDPDDGRDTVIWFGVRVDMTQPACDYGGEVVITAAVN